MEKIYSWLRSGARVMLSLACLAAGTACNGQTKAKHNNITISEEKGLVIYEPKFGKVDLVCKDMPSEKDAKVLMCCEAAFTGQLLNDFKHSNIAGNHVSSGKYHKGYKCRVNSGCFAYYADTKTWTFGMGDYDKCLQDAAKRGGCGFGQVMVIHEGKKQKLQATKGDRRNEYRVLAEYKGKLCIIDSKGSMRYGDFIDSLLAIGVKHALYLDMGAGWNYSYYRDNNDKVKFIHGHKIKHTTNWITFWK